MPGDKVKFFLDDPAPGSKPIKRQFGLVAGVDGAPKITALHVFGVTDRTKPEVRNLCRLLLTLGGIPAQGAPIQLPAQLPVDLPPTLPNFTSVTFDTEINTAGFPLTITVPQADTHLSGSLPTVTVNFAGTGSGTVSSTPAGINNCTATCSNTFVNGDSVTLTAVGGGFAGWSAGSGNAACNNNATTCTFTVSSDSSITATFNPSPPQTLTTSIVGNGGVTCSTDGGATFNACAPQYNAGAALVLKATALPLSSFQNWSAGAGNATVCNNTSGNCSFTLNANSTVTANFVLNTVIFSLSATSASTNGGGGTIACSTTGGAPFGVCAPSYNAGTPLTLQASSTNLNFTGWGSGTGSAATCNGSANPLCSFTLTANSAVIANFNRPTLSVLLSGAGSVSSNPAGITCNPTCSAAFNKGTVVTLTATGDGFTGWSGGGCSGIAPCPVTLNTDTTVTANFGQVTTSARWLFYTDHAGTIRYADPANPGATTTSLTTTGFAVSKVFTGAWDSTNFAYTNLTTPYLTYFQEGKLFRVFTAKSSGVPGSVSNLPVQISSETAATTVCEINHVVNLTVNNTKLLYELPGGDNNCLTKNDNVTRSVVVSDNSTTPPTSPLAPGLVVDSGGRGAGNVFDLSTGLATHILLLDAANSNTLKLMNVTTNAITTIQANVGDVDFLVQDTSDRVFLHGGATRQILYLYTISTNSLVPLVTGASSLKHGRLVGDGTNLYVAEQATGKLYKVPMNATQPSDVVTLLAGLGLPLGGIFGGNDAVVVTTNNVFLQTYVPCSGGCTSPNEALDASGLYRVSKAVAPATATPIIPHAVGTGIFNVRSAGSLLYYNHKFAPSIPQANIINENGTPVFSSPITCPGGCAGWQAVIYSPTFFVRTSGQHLSKVILTAFANTTQNGATLSAFDAPTGVLGATLGIVPPTTPTLRSLFGDDGLDTVMLLIGQQNGSPDNFLFFVDTVLASSLTQVPTGTAAPWFFAD